MESRLTGSHFVHGVNSPIETLNTRAVRAGVKALAHFLKVSLSYIGVVSSTASPAWAARSAISKV